MKFEKTGTGEAAPKKAVVAPVEEPVDVNTPLDKEMEALEAESKQIERLVRAEHRARNRARMLLTAEVLEAYSPSKRFDIKLPEGCPFGLRWCDEDYRKKHGLGIWVPVTAEEFEDLKPFVNVDQVEIKEDGRVMSGGLFLAKAPRDKIEALSALYYQRSQRRMKAAVAGQMSAQVSGRDTLPSMEKFVQGANAGLDEPMVKFTGTMKEG